MINQLKNFQYIDRGREKTLVLIPGWASDYRIFNSLDLDFNYLSPIEFSPFSFGEELFSAIEDIKCNKVSLFGWSMGGFLAADFAYKFNALVDELILVSIRKKYKPDELKAIEEMLKKNKKAYLYSFYRSCFHDANKLTGFIKDLLKGYCVRFSLESLLKTLDYLSKTEINTKFSGKTKIIHGQYDKIAPIEEARGIQGTFQQAEFICINNTGHAPFLESGL